MEKKKKYILLGLLFLTLLTAYILYSAGNNNRKGTDINQISETTIEDIKKRNLNIQKKTEFIDSHLPNEVGYLDFDKEEMKDASLEKLRIEALTMFYAAIKENDLDYLLSVFIGESLEDVFGDEINIEKRIELLEEQLQIISRDGKINDFKYQFYFNKYNQVLDEGEIHLLYQDDIEIEIPFELVYVESEQDRLFRFKTHLTDITEKVLNYDWD